MRRHPSVLALCALLTFTACPKKGGEGASSDPASAQQAATAEAPPPTLTPVATPEHIFMVARVESVAAMLDSAVEQWGESYDWRAKVAEIDDPLAQLLDFDASVDLIVTIDPNLPPKEGLRLAAAFGVRSVDEIAAALEEDHPVRGLAGGVYRARMDEDGDPAEAFTCEVGPALGPAPAKFVCGRGNLSLDALGPYMRRGKFESLPVKSAFALSMDFEPFRETFRPQLREALQSAGMAGSLGVASIQDADLRDAAATAMRALLDEAANLYEDLGVVNIEGVLGGPSSGFTSSVKLRMEGRKSFISRAFTGGEDLMAPAPDDFWRLPADASSASFTHAKLTDDSRAIGQVLGRLLLGSAREFDFPTKKLAKAIDLYGKVAGQVPEGDVLVLQAESVDHAFDESWPEEFRDRIADMGVYLIGVQQAPDYLNMVKAWVDVYNDKAMQRKLLSFAPDLKSLPRLRWAKASAKTKLPRGSYELSLVFPKAWLDKETKIKKLPEFSIFFVPDGKRMWTSIAFDRKGALAALHSVLKPAGKTLADAPAAQRFRTQKVSQGSWASMEHSFIEEVFEEVIDESNDPAEREALQAAHESWLAKWKDAPLPGITGWSDVGDLEWRSTWRMETQTVGALMDLFAALVRAESKQADAVASPVQGALDGPPPAAKKRVAPKK